MSSRIASLLRRLGQLTIASLCAAVIGTTAFGQAPKIEITEPVIKEAQDAIKIAFKITGASQKRIRVKVDCGVDAVTSKEIGFSSTGEHVISVNLFKGANTITLIGFVNDDPSSTLAAPIPVHCTGRWCREPFGLNADTVASEYREGAGPAPAPTASPTPQQQGGGGKPNDQPKQAGSIFIETPKAADSKSEIHYPDSSTIPFEITVKPKDDPTKNVKSIYVRVMNQDVPISQKVDELKVEYPKDDTKAPAKIKAQIKIAKGANDVTVFERGKFDSEHDAVRLVCDNCGSGDAEVAADDGKSKITIEEPKTKTGEAYEVEDQSSIDSWVTIPPGINQIQYDVITAGRQEIFRSPVIDGNSGKEKKKIPLRLRFLDGLNTVRIYDVAHPGESDTSIMIKCKGPKCAKDFGELTTFSTPFTRGIVGLEQAAAASANPEQKLFLEFNLTAPLFRKGRSPLEAPLWLWLNPRITSLPTQVSTSVAEFSTSSNFFSPFTQGKVNDIVQGFEFTGGFEIPIRLSGRGYVTGPIISGFGPKTKVRFGVSALVGAGVQAPFSAQKTVQVFKVNDSVIERFPDVGTNTQIAFVSGDRTRFFRQYFAGLRLKTYYVNGEEGQEDHLDSIFPGILDVTFGQNESVTRACLCGVVTHIEGIFPLPFIKGDKRGSVYVFGSASLKLNDAQVLKPVFLEPVIPQPQVPGAGIFIKQVPFEDRDHYRLGVGVDLIRLIKQH